MKNHLQHAFHLNDIARVATATKKKNTTLSVQSRPFSSTLYLVVKTTLSGPKPCSPWSDNSLARYMARITSQMTHILTSQSTWDEQLVLESML